MGSVFGYWMVVFGVGFVSAIVYMAVSLAVFLKVRRHQAYDGPDLFHSLQSHRWPGWLLSGRYLEIYPGLRGLIWLARIGFVATGTCLAAMLVWPSSPWSLLNIFSGLAG